MKERLLASLALVASCLVATTVWADDARVEVATIDGAPVYHWQTFKSFLADDVDRALLIREFRRQGFTLPAKLVDDAVKQQTVDQFGGSRDKFVRHLRGEGVTMAEFRAFVTEEIIANAMLYQEAKTPAEQARLQTEFLAKLRAGAVVKRLSGKTEESATRAKTGG